MRMVVTAPFLSTTILELIDHLLEYRYSDRALRYRPQRRSGHPAPRRYADPTSVDPDAATQENRTFRSADASSTTALRTGAHAPRRNLDLPGEDRAVNHPIRTTVGRATLPRPLRTVRRYSPSGWKYPKSADPSVAPGFPTPRTIAPTANPYWL